MRYLSILALCSLLCISCAKNTGVYEKFTLDHNQDLRSYERLVMDGEGFWNVTGADAQRTNDTIVTYDADGNIKSIEGGGSVSLGGANVTAFTKEQAQIALEMLKRLGM